MKNKIDDKRRSVIKGLAILPAAPILMATGVAQAGMLGTDNPQAAALQYTETTPNAAQRCDNCALYAATDDTKGACSIFPGSQVAAAGWCTAWAPKG